MAKASMKAREERRRRTVLKYASKRAELKEIIRSPKFSQEEKEAAQITHISQHKPYHMTNLSYRSPGVYSPVLSCRHTMSLYIK